MEQISMNHSSLRAARVSGKPVKRFVPAEQLESRCLLAADLSGSFTAVPASFLPGGRNRLVLRVNNSGDTNVSGATVGVNLFASTDQTLDGADLSIFTLSKRLSARAASGANVNLAFSSPTNVPDGD